MRLSSRTISRCWINGVQPVYQTWLHTGSTGRPMASNKVNPMTDISERRKITLQTDALHNS